MIAKLLITLATLFYGIVPLIADLNDTHLFHPDWTPHSKLHTAWLLGTQSSIALLALYLLWKRSEPIVAASMGLCVMLGFWIAVLARGFYDGALVDVGRVHATILGFNPNAFAFTFVSGFLLLGLILEFRNRGT